MHFDLTSRCCRSSLVEKVLIGALRAMREEDENASFNVIVVDSSPLFEGETRTSAR